jgi:hypothetical protein
MNRYRRLVPAKAITPAYVGIELGSRLKKGFALFVDSSSARYWK